MERLESQEGTTGVAKTLHGFRLTRTADAGIGLGTLLEAGWAVDAIDVDHTDDYEPVLYQLSIVPLPGEETDDELWREIGDLEESVSALERDVGRLHERIAKVERPEAGKLARADGGDET